MQTEPKAAYRERFERELDAIMTLAYRYAYRLSGNQEDAMDLVQDATLLAYRSFESFQEGTNFKAWFLRILTNRYFGKLRAAKKLSTVPIEEAPDLFLFEQTKRAGVPQGDDPAAWIMGQMDGELIQRALDKLSEEYKVVAMLHFMSELSYEQIAEMLEIPIGTVRSRLHRARKQLQVALWQIAEERGFVLEGQSR